MPVIDAAVGMSIISLMVFIGHLVTLRRLRTNGAAGPDIRPTP